MQGYPLEPILIRDRRRSAMLTSLLAGRAAPLRLQGWGETGGLRLRGQRLTGGIGATPSGPQDNRGHALAIRRARADTPD
jgi:hypothetical protein